LYWLRRLAVVPLYHRPGPAARQLVQQDAWLIIGFLESRNDFFGPLIYLNTPEKYTLSLGLANFQRVVSAGGQATEHLLMAASMVMTLPSILVFILLQRYYIQGVVISSGSK